MMKSVWALVRSSMASTTAATRLVCASSFTPPSVPLGGVPQPSGAAAAPSRTPPAVTESGHLRHARDRVLVEAHHLRDALVHVPLAYAEVLHDQARVGHVAQVLLILAQGGELLGAPADLHEALDRPAVRAEERHVERLDLPLLLHAAVQPDGLVEDLQAALLAPGYVRAPRDEHDA